MLVPLLLMAAPSWAAETVFVAPLFELLPLDEIVADGARSYDLELLAFGTDGTPLTGLVLSGKPPVSPKLAAKAGISTKNATAGVVGPAVQIEPGRFKVSWTPDAVTAPTTVPITFKGKTAEGVKLNEVWELPVVPVPGFSLALEVSPKEIVLGTGAGTATLSVALTTVSPGLYDTADLQFTASTGEVKDLVNLGEGRWSARLVPPGYAEPSAAPASKTAKPQPPDNALISVSDRGSPMLTYGAVSLPLVARQDVPVTSKTAVLKHGGRLLLDVAGQTYGPIDADKRGKAIIPAVMIPPGTTTAKLTTITANEQVESDVALPVPPSRRAWVLVTPASIPADPAFTIPLRVFVVTPDGKPAENAQVAATVTDGQVAVPVHEGGGLYRIDYTPPVSSVDKVATLNVFVDATPGPKVKPSDTRSLALVGTKATELALTSQPGAAGLVTVTCTVQAGGVGLEGRKVRFVAAGGSRVGEVRDLGKGVYEADFRATGTGDMLVDAVSMPHAGANSVREVLLVPDRTRTTNDPLADVPITVLALDEYGYPVRGAEVALEVLEGGGKLPSSKVTTDESGTAFITYTPTKAAALARVRATVKNDVHTIAILQVPDAALPAMAALPPFGNAEDQSLGTTWGGLRARTRIAR